MFLSSVNLFCVNLHWFEFLFDAHRYIRKLNDELDTTNRWFMHTSSSNHWKRWYNIMLMAYTCLKSSNLFLPLYLIKLNCLLCTISLPTYNRNLVSCYCHFDSISYYSWGVAHEVQNNHQNRDTGITDISFTLFMVTIRTCRGNSYRWIFVVFHRNL